MQEALHTSWVIAYREFIRFFQQRSRLFASVAVPALFLILLGGGLRLAADRLDQGMGFLQFVFPAFVVITVVTSSLFTGLSVVWDREFGFMRVILVAPFSRTGVVLGKVFGGGTLALGQGVVIAALAPSIGIDVGGEEFLQMIPILFLLSMSISALGVAASSRLNSQQGYLVVVQLLVLVLVFFSGTFVPVEDLPAWMQAGAAINPVHYAVDAMRQIYLDDPSLAAPFTFVPAASIATDAVIITASGIAFGAIAVRAFEQEG